MTVLCHAGTAACSLLTSAFGFYCSKPPLTVCIFIRAVCAVPLTAFSGDSVQRIALSRVGDTICDCCDGYESTYVNALV